MSTAYALCPAFGEAAVVELGVGLRPSFPDNMPRAIMKGRVVHVNGAYRHGFLLAPVLAAAVADLLERGEADPELIAVG
jgi:glycine oxidase